MTGALEPHACTAFGCGEVWYLQWEEAKQCVCVHPPPRCCMHSHVVMKALSRMPRVITAVITNTMPSAMTCSRVVASRLRKGLRKTGTQEGGRQPPHRLLHSTPHALAVPLRRPRLLSHYICTALRLTSYCPPPTVSGPSRKNAAPSLNSRAK